MLFLGDSAKLASLAFGHGLVSCIVKTVEITTVLLVAVHC